MDASTHAWNLDSTQLIWTLGSFSMGLCNCLFKLPYVVQCSLTFPFSWYKSICPFFHLVCSLFAYAFCISTLIQVNLGEYKGTFYFSSFCWCSRWDTTPLSQLFGLCALMLQYSSGYIYYFFSRFCFKTFVPCCWSV